MNYKEALQITKSLNCSNNQVTQEYKDYVIDAIEKANLYEQQKDLIDEVHHLKLMIREREEARYNVRKRETTNDWNRTKLTPWEYVFK